MSDARTKRLNESQKPITDGGIADDFHKLILPKNTTAHLAEIAPQEAMVAYDTDQQCIVVDSGSGFAPAGGSGTVTSVATGTGLSGGPVTGSGTISLANTAVTPGSYTNTNLTVDAQGRITVAANGSSSGASGAAGDIQFSNGSGAFDSDAGINWDDTGKNLSLSAPASEGRLSIGIGNDTDFQAISMRIASAPGYGFDIMQDAVNTGDFFINSVNNGGSTDVLHIQRGSGNVGINKNGPGAKLDVQGDFRLSGNNSGWVGFAPQNDAGSVTYTLPDTDGSIGQALTTNGAALLSWASPGIGTLANNVYLNGRNAADDTDLPLVKISASDHTIFGNDGLGYIDINPSGRIDLIANGGSGAIQSHASGFVLLPSGGTPQNITFADGTNTDFVAVVGPTAPGVSTTLVLPAGVGVAGQVLTTDGNNPANLSWSTVSAIRISDGTITVSATTDRTIIADTTLAPVTVNLPAGQAGLQYYIKDNGHAGSVGNVTINANGGDLFEDGSGSVVVNVDFRGYHFQFLSGIWYVLSKVDSI